MSRNLAALTGVILLSTALPAYSQAGLDPYAHIRPTRTTKTESAATENSQNGSATATTEAMPRSLDPEHCGMVVQVLDSAFAGGKKIGRGILSGTRRIGSGITGGTKRLAKNDEKQAAPVAEPNTVK